MAERSVHDLADACEGRSIAFITEFFVPNSRIEAGSDRAHKPFEIARAMLRIIQDALMPDQATLERVNERRRKK